MLDELFAERTLAEWEEVLSRQSGQWDVFLTAGRVRHDEQVQANEFAQLVEHDGDGKVVLVPAPAQFDGEVTQLGRGPSSAPTPTTVLTSLGFDAAAIADLRARTHRRLTRRRPPSRAGAAGLPGLTRGRSRTLEARRIYHEVQLTA